MKRKILVLIMGMLILLGLSGCMEIPDDETLRSYSDQMLAAISQGDEDAGYALIRDACTEEDFKAFCRQAAEQLGDIGIYTLTPIGYSRNTTNGVTQTAISYRMESENGEFLVQAMKRSDMNGLAGFHVSREIPVTTTGTLTTMQGALWDQWLALIAGMAGIAFVIWGVVDCARNPIPKKWLWILLILLVQLIVSLSLSQGHIGLNFNAGIYLTYTALLRSSTGETVLRIVIPLGAIIYFSFRKKLMTPKEAPVPDSESVPE